MLVEEEAEGAEKRHRRSGQWTTVVRTALTPTSIFGAPSNGFTILASTRGIEATTLNTPTCVWRYASVAPDKPFINRADWYLPTNNPSWEGNYQVVVWIGCDASLWKADNARYQVLPYGSGGNVAKTINIDQYRPGAGCLFDSLFKNSPYKTYFDDSGYVGLIDRSSSHPTYIAADFALYQR